VPKQEREAKPSELIKKEPVEEILGISHASLSLKKANVAERQADAAKRLLSQLSKCKTRIEAEYYDTACLVLA